MAIFGTKKEDEKTKATHARAVKFTEGAEHDVILSPWLSEKGFLSTEKGVYVFAVDQRATKGQVAGAVKALYGVSAKKVRIVNVKGKPKMMRSRRGVGSRASRKKAYVYLNAGDKIALA